MTNILTIIISAAAAVLGFLLGPLCCKILNKIPAPWLCDYDEEPSQELLSGNRYKIKPTGYIMGAVLAVAMGGTAYLSGLSATLPLVLVMFVFLMLISASDAKYTIIPDQFTVAVAVISAVYAVTDLLTKQAFIDRWYSPLLGSALGFGLLILLDLLSTLIFKKTGFGFGDAKLLAALGLLFGYKYITVMLVIAFLTAAIYFLVLIFSGKAKKGIYLPMGPYICFAAAATLVLQPQIQYLLGMYKYLLSMDILP